MALEHVPGKNAGHVMLYALSTCPWCKKTKQLLDDLGVDYYYEYVDLLQGDERDAAIGAVQRWNPKYSFPTLIINGDKSIVGFKENETREALQL